MKSNAFFLLALCAAALSAGFAKADETFTPIPDPVYQYSVPVPDSKQMRAYLWIPPNCQRVRGVIIAVQNMLEQFILADPEIRQAAADSDLGIIWITPGDDFVAGPGRTSPYHTFNPGKMVADHIVQVLKDLAVESGYSELAFAPMIPTAHSAATPFVWGLASALPERMIAIFPCKGWFGSLPPNVPELHMASEYGEVGGVNWGETYLKDRVAIMKIRAGGEESLIGESVDIGAGHYEWNPAAGKIAAMFIRKAVALRVPQEAPVDAPVQLNRIDPRSGYLMNPDQLGTPDAQPIAASDWKGDPKTGLWYFDAEMAKTINDSMVEALAKKPQVIDFLIDGAPAPLGGASNGGVAVLKTDWLADGCSFQVKAAFLDKSPTVNLYGGAEVGHSSTGSILFKVGSGCVKQIGSDTFRPWVHRGGYIQQGSPWDPIIIAYHPGDAEYRRADRPGHPWITLMDQDGNPQPKDGAPQTLDFPKIDNQIDGTPSLQLKATASSGLPVQFWVISGPVELADDNATLKFLPIPPRSHYPVRVIIGAYQWGRAINPKVQSTPPATQEFFINKQSR